MYITVKEFVSEISSTLYSEFNKTVKIRGEISNYKMMGKNIYFSLKNDDSVLNIVVWNYSNIIKQKFKTGDDVVVTGKLMVFKKNSSYQLSASDISKMGIGDLHSNFIKLKERYQKKGYFDNKKQMPLINNICIITAKGSAAMEDLLYVLNNGGYKGKVSIKNSLMQGNDCPSSVKNAIKMVDKMNFDAIIISRGGGSFEDLNGFNHPMVIKAIYNANTYIISAIGHEIDFMLSDFAADLRAPTPSIAGEIICTQYKNQYQVHIDNHIESLNNVKLMISDKINKILNDVEKFKLFSPINVITNHQKDLDNQLNNIKLKMLQYFEQHKSPNICNLFNVTDNIEIDSLKSFKYAIDNDCVIRYKFHDGSIEI